MLQHRLGWCWAVLVLGLMHSPIASSHQLLPGYLELEQQTSGLYSVLWKVPLQQGRLLPIAPRFPSSCHLQGDLESVIESSAWIYRATLRCTSGLEGQTIAIDGLGAAGNDVLVRYKWIGHASPRTILLNGEQPSAYLGSAGADGHSGWVFYLRLGVQHILSGVDHLLFLVGLLLLAQGRWALLKTVTAFTIAHSLTLGSATVGWAGPWVGPVNVETAIALSILILGVEVARKWAGKDSFTIRYPWLVAFGFGLVHGLAFASDLAELNLPIGEMIVAVLLFNLGVEIGQVGFIVLVLGLVLPLRTRSLPTWFRRIPGYAVGVAGAFWTFERTTALFLYGGG
ncbi:MAG: HupE/UreJ family protein [Arenicellales bacterium]|nr:HupE/UreJ family protein [Arenicellales bacterium]MDP6918285.1 HupE/UreJ family protein [Arenicellales bacterium]